MCNEQDTVFPVSTLELAGSGLGIPLHVTASHRLCMFVSFLGGESSDDTQLNHWTKCVVRTQFIT